MDEELKSDSQVTSRSDLTKGLSNIIMIISVTYYTNYHHFSEQPALIFLKPVRACFSCPAKPCGIRWIGQKARVD